MNKKTIIALVLAAAATLVITQLWPSLGNPVQADLRDMDDVHRFVQEEIIDVSRQEFDAWEMYYLDVSNDGVEELVLVSPLVEQRHPFLEIIRVEGRKLQRIPAEIPLTNSGTIPEVQDGFLAVTANSSDSIWFRSDLDIYLYDGTKIGPSLLTVTLFRSEPGEDEITGHLDGPLTNFTNTLLNIDPLRAVPVVRKGVYQYRFDQESNSFSVEQLEEEEPSYLEISEYAEVNRTYVSDPNGSGIIDTLRLEVREKVQLVINEEAFALNEVHAADLEPQYQVVPIDEDEGYAFVLYGGAADAETYFVRHTKDEGAALMGVVRTDHSLYRAPILSIHRDRAVVDYMVYPFAGGAWHVSEDEGWLLENTDLNIGGRFNLQSLAHESFGSHWIAYDQYVAVIVPMYEGINRDQLTKKPFSVGSDGGTKLSFAVFGTMHNTVITYVESYFSDDEPITKDLGTLENVLVTIDAALPWDTSFLRVDGMVYGGEGWENQIQFVLDDMRSLEEYEPIFVVY